MVQGAHLVVIEADLPVLVRAPPGVHERAQVRGDGAALVGLVDDLRDELRRIVRLRARRARARGPPGPACDARSSSGSSALRSPFLTGQNTVLDHAVHLPSSALCDSGALSPFAYAAATACTPSRSWDHTRTPSVQHKPMSMSHAGKLQAPAGTVILGACVWREGAMWLC